MSRPEPFEPGRHYVIVEAFEDFDRLERRVGDVMRFESREFAIYDGGTTLHFTDPEGGGFRIRLRDVDQEDVLRRLDQIFRVATVPELPAGPLRADAELLASARVGAAVYAIATGYPAEEFEADLERLGLFAAASPQERGWLLGETEAGAEATWRVEQTASLAWVLGLTPRFRGLSEEETGHVCESLMLDAPALELRSQAEVEAELAWCEALIEFRATGVEVWPSLEDAALAEHRNALRWALGA